GRANPVLPVATRPEYQRMSRDAVAAPIQDDRQLIQAGPRARAARVEEDQQRRPTAVEQHRTTGRPTNGHRPGIARAGCIGSHQEHPDGDRQPPGSEQSGDDATMQGRSRHRSSLGQPMSGWSAYFSETTLEHGCARGAGDSYDTKGPGTESAWTNLLRQGGMGRNAGCAQRPPKRFLKKSEKELP